MNLQMLLAHTNIRREESELVLEVITESDSLEDAFKISIPRLDPLKNSQQALSYQYRMDFIADRNNQQLIQRHLCIDHAVSWSLIYH